MKVALVNYSDSSGGAARAAYRLHKALRQNNVDSRMYVNEAKLNDPTVIAREDYLSKALARGRGPLVSLMLRRLMGTGNPTLHSLSVIPSNWSSRLNKSDADLVNLHWLNREMLSISDIGRITKPVIWTLHDMWAFSGAEHLSSEARWHAGYTRRNRPSHESGLDLNRWVWSRKRRCWARKFHIVTPSNWLADCVRESALMCGWPVTVIPNVIDTGVWVPIDKNIARQVLNFPANIPLLLFGAIGGTTDRNKGFDLLRSALDVLDGRMKGLQLVVFGESTPEDSVDTGFPIHYVGHFGDDVSLRLLYSAADAIVVPSRQESFGQTASEAHACACPAVAFDATGLRDVVKHKQTGYLAEPYNSRDLAYGIEWVLESKKRISMLSTEARRRAVSLWSPEVVVPQYIELFDRVIGEGAAVS